jgi:hypothetical protein
LFGCLFDDIYIKRYDAEGNETGLLKVPITYAPKEKMLARVLEDPGIDRPAATMPLPCLSFETGTLKYDGSRKLNTTLRNSAKMDDVNPNNFLTLYSPVPFNIDYKLHIYAKNPEDGNKILEQVLPFFTPDWTTRVNLIPEMNIEMDIPIVLNNVGYTDNYDREFKERRAIIWTLDFLLKGYFFGPIKRKPIIKFANTSFYAVSGISLSQAVGNWPVGEIMTTEPGLLANGSPTSSKIYSIDVDEIMANSEYGYITEIL